MVHLGQLGLELGVGLASGAVALHDMGHCLLLHHGEGAVDQHTLEGEVGDIAQVHQPLCLLEPQDWPGLLVGGQLESPGGSPVGCSFLVATAAATVLLARLGGMLRQMCCVFT